MNIRTILLLLVCLLFIVILYTIHNSNSHVEKFRIPLINKNIKVNNSPQRQTNLSLLDDPKEKKTLTFLEKYVFYTPYLMYYPMTISTLSRENNELYKKNYKALYDDMSSNPF